MTSNLGHIPDITDTIPDITGIILDITSNVPDTVLFEKLDSGLWPGFLVISGALQFDVRNVWNMTRIFVHVPDIVGTGPDIAGTVLDIAGTILLVTFQTKQLDVRNMTR